MGARKKVQTKRKSSHLRKTIDRRVRAHNRKVKREAKRMKATGVYKKKAEDKMVLPNSYPFKLEALEQAEREKKVDDLKKKEQQKAKQEQRKKQKQIDEEGEDGDQTETNQVQVEQQVETIPFDEVMASDKRKFYKQYQELIDNSDIIIQVLDARDPELYRNHEVEKQILANSSKQLFFLLNKADAVPRKNLNTWISQLNQVAPSYCFAAKPFKNYSQMSSLALYSETLAKKLAQKNDPSEFQLDEHALTSKLNEIAKKKFKGKPQVYVSFVGFPNAGKNSIIYLLKQKAKNVDQAQNLPKFIYQFQIDTKTYLIDTPGFFTAQNQNSSLLKIAKISDCTKPAEAIKELLTKAKRAEILILYRVPDYKDVNEFLVSVAKTRGRLCRNGQIDTDGAARLVLEDWLSGKLKYSVLPQ